MIKIEVHQLIPINLLDKTKAEEKWVNWSSQQREISLTELCEVYQAAKVYRQYNKIHFKNKNHPKPHYALFCDKYVTKFENTYWTHVYQILDDNLLSSKEQRRTDKMDWEKYTRNLDLNFLIWVMSLWFFYYFCNMDIYNLFQTK